VGHEPAVYAIRARCQWPRGDDARRVAGGIELYEGFVSETPRVGPWLDTTDLSAGETVDEIPVRTPA
jgi:hypothetical protein